MKKKKRIKFNFNNLFEYLYILFIPSINEKS